ncbi:MAG: alpha/beta hydrolase [Chloroflexota bacterium]
MTKLINTKLVFLLAAILLASIFAGCDMPAQSSSDPMENIQQEDDYIPASFVVDGENATMEGDIDGTTPDRVRELRQNHPNVTTIIMLDVPGSVDDDANLVASRLVREYGYNTFVPANGLIASGGVDFFLAGVQRSIESGAQLGVHSWAAGDDLAGSDLPRDDPEHDKYLDYYNEMGIPEDFYWFTLQAAPAEDIHFMTDSEIEQYNVVTSSDASSEPAETAPQQSTYVIYLPFIEQPPSTDKI